MRVLSACAFAFASILLGLSSAQSLIRREKLLGELYAFFLRLENGFRSSNELVADMLLDASLSGEFKRLSFLNEIATGLKEGKALSELWRSKTDVPGLHADEKDNIVRFGLLLGTTDSRGQIGLCERYAEMFKLLQSEALEKRKRLSGVYVSLGAAGAVCVVLMLV